MINRFSPSSQTLKCLFYFYIKTPRIISILKLREENGFKNLGTKLYGEKVLINKQVF